MKLSGEWSLKRRISPCSKALNDAAEDGRQKFTSSTPLEDAWRVNQCLSVTAMKSRILMWRKYNAGLPPKFRDISSGSETLFQRILPLAARTVGTKAGISPALPASYTHLKNGEPCSKCGVSGSRDLIGLSRATRALAHWLPACRPRAHILDRISASAGGRWHARDAHGGSGPRPLPARLRRGRAR